MKATKTTLVTVLAMAAVTGQVERALADDEASHFRYGTLSWVPTGNPGEVEFRLKAAFRRGAYFGSRCIPFGCSGVDGNPITTDIIIEAQGPTQFNFGDGSAVTSTLRFLVTAHNDSANPEFDWVLGEMLDPNTGAVGIRHTYAPGTYSAFLAGFASHPTLSGAVGCCRIGQFGIVTLNNRSGTTYPLHTVVDAFSGNSSPVSSMVPIVIVPQSASAQFLVPGADADGDPISFRLATDLEFGSSIGATNLSNLTIDASSGLATWNNIGFSQTGFWTTQIVVEDLDANGNVISKTPVDFLLKIVTQVGSFPSCSITPSGPLTVAVGSPVSFTITGIDPDAGDTIELNSGGLPPGATMTPALPVSGSPPVSSTFNWTPGAGQVGSHIVVFSVTDSNGQQDLCSITLSVIEFVEVSVDIKPGSCPNPVNPGSEGYIPISVLGTADFDPMDIDLTTVVLSRADGVGGDVDPNEGPLGPHSVFEDTATPFDGELCDCHDLEGDGFDDLSMKFKTQDVVAALELDLEIPGTVLELVVSGDLLDGTPFVGSDCIVIVGGGP